MSWKESLSLLISNSENASNVWLGSNIHSVSCFDIFRSMSTVGHLHIPAFYVFVHVENSRFSFFLGTQVRNTTISRHFYYMDLTKKLSRIYFQYLLSFLPLGGPKKTIFLPRLSFTLAHSLRTTHVCMRSLIWKILKLDTCNFLKKLRRQGTEKLKPPQKFVPQRSGDPFAAWKVLAQRLRFIVLWIVHDEPGYLCWVRLSDYCFLFWHHVFWSTL